MPTPFCFTHRHAFVWNMDGLACQDKKKRIFLGSTNLAPGKNKSCSPWEFPPWKQNREHHLSRQDMLGRRSTVSFAALQEAPGTAYGKWAWSGTTHGNPWFLWWVSTCRCPSESPSPFWAAEVQSWTSSQPPRPLNCGDILSCLQIINSNMRIPQQVLGKWN